MRKYLMLAALAGSLIQTACESHHEHHEAESAYAVTSPIRTDTSITNKYVCQIHSIQHIELRAQEHGYLENIFVDEGQTVKKGQLMFRVMPALYEAEVHRAAAEAKVARIEYQNTKSLADSGVVSPNELAMTEAKFEKAQAELELAKVHLNFTEIKAPFDGIMDRFHVRMGSLLEEGELLTELSDNSKMWVYFNVPEAEYLDYKARVKGDSVMKVNLLMANNKLFAHDGYVETIEADFNNETGNIAFRATFPNPDGLLRHGETGNILMRTVIHHALLIPQKATYEVLDQKYVYVVDENSEIQARHITVSAEMPHLYVVNEGLEEGDIILLEGLRKVRAGDHVKTEFKEPWQVIENLDVYAE